MRSHLKNILRNAAFQLAYFGEGPWTTSGRTLPFFKLTRTNTPDISVTRRTLDASTSTDKRLRSRYCMHLALSTLTAGENATITQYVDDARRFAGESMLYQAYVYGPRDATFRIGFQEGSSIVTEAITTQGIGGGTEVTGTAQSGAAGTITLNAGASATDDAHTDRWIEITAGTGLGQMRLITDYVGATKVATVEWNWTTNPDNTSVFAIANAPLVTYVRRGKAGDDYDTEYALVQLFGTPSQVGDYTLGPCDFRVHQEGESEEMEIRTPDIEELLCADRYYPVPNGVHGVSSTVAFFAGVSFPMPMRTTPSFVAINTSSIDVIAAAAGTTVTLAVSPSPGAGDITTRGARFFVTNGSGLTNNIHQILGTAVTGCFTADYF